MDVKESYDVVDGIRIFSGFKHNVYASKGKITSTCPPTLPKLRPLSSDDEFEQMAEDDTSDDARDASVTSPPSSPYTKQYEVLLSEKELQPLTFRSSEQNDFSSSPENFDCVLDPPTSPKTTNSWESILPLLTKKDENENEEPVKRAPSSGSISLLADAARYLEVHRTLQEAESVLDSLLNRFAEPRDLCTSVKNLLSDEEAPLSGSSVPQKRQTSFPSQPTFSPVFKHLLCLPESHVLSGVQDMTPTAQCLNDLCTSLSNTIARSKRKLRQLNKIRSEKKRERDQPAQTPPQLTSSNQKEANDWDLPNQERMWRRKQRFQTTLTEIIQKPQSNSAFNAPPPAEHYSDPTTCPLSLLSFVFNLKGGGEEVEQRSYRCTSQLLIDLDFPDEPSLSCPNSDVGPLADIQVSPSSARPRGRPRSSSSPKRRKSIRTIIKKGSSPTKNFTKHSKSRHLEYTPARSRNSSGPPDMIAGKKITENETSLETKYPHVPTYLPEDLPPASFAPNSFSISSLSPMVMEELTVCIRPLSDNTLTDTSSCSQNNSTASVKTNSSPSTFALNVENFSPGLHPLPEKLSSEIGNESDDCSVWKEEDMMRRPPTPELRRIDLDLNDLSDGLRILLIEDTHLRAGTLYFVEQLTPKGNERHRPSHESPRNRMCRVKLDNDRDVHHGHYSQQPISVAMSPPPAQGERRGRSGGDVILQAWQVLQQAVLEVIPASIRQLPPGTRVCAAWSDKLATNLYPGTISENSNFKNLAEVFLEPTSLSVDFDDGDHREVLLSRIRMLPDHFANLTELGNAASSLVKESSPVRVRHSSVSSFSTSMRSKIPEKKRKMSLSRSLENPSKMCHRGIVKRSYLFAENDIDDDASSFSSGVKYDRYNWSENEENKDKQQQKMKEKSDADSSSEVIWKPRKKTRRKFRGMVCFQSLKREKDGLLVSVGDVVKFNSGVNEDVYLGEIKYICQSNAPNASPVVFAFWFYYPSEAGKDGELVRDYKGAIFSTEHMDDNEAQCIIGRVSIAHSLAKFRQANKRREKTRNGGDKLPKLTQVKYSDDNNNNWESSKLRPEDGTSGSEEGEEEEKEKGGETGGDNDVDGGTGSDYDDYDEDEDECSSSDDEAPKFFVAGKFDPLLQRVTSWDASISSELHLSAPG